MFNKKIISLVLVFILVLATVPSFASNSLDFSKKGSIEVILKNKDEALEGAEMVLYRVAEAVEKDNNLVFVYTDEFKDSGVKLDYTDEDFVLEMASFIEARGIKGESKKTDSQGRLVFEDLDLGLYLIRQLGSLQGYYPTSPFLAPLPIYDEGWEYTVVASPKQEEWNEKPGPKPEEPEDKEEEKVPPLINTGQLQWPIPVMVVLGLALFSVGWVMNRKNDMSQQ